VDISIEPPTEQFSEWWEAETAQTGQFSPHHLNDPDLAGTVAATAGGLDTSMAVAHLITITIPRQSITMQCIQHWRCSNGRWVKSHKESRETERRRLSDIVITSESIGPKVSSADVERLIRKAQGRYQQLAQADDRLQQYCT
jgi:NH3-dependent NAD+ synthetase